MRNKREELFKLVYNFFGKDEGKLREIAKRIGGDAKIVKFAIRELENTAVTQMQITIVHANGVITIVKADLYKYTQTFTVTSAFLRKDVLVELFENYEDLIAG